MFYYLQSRVLLGAAPSSPNAGMPSPVSHPVVSAHVSSHVTLGNLYLVKQTIFLCHHWPLGVM